MGTTVVDNVVSHYVIESVNKALFELKYLCCYMAYVDEFKEKKKKLNARTRRVRKDIEEARDRNENVIDDEVDLWLKEADELIEEVTEGKETWFGAVTDYVWQYKRGKELAEKTQKIEELMHQSNEFSRVARSTRLVGFEFYSSQHFMPFKKRTEQIGTLKEALKDDKHHIIGLWGLGGTGKTSVAIEVSKEVAKSKWFDRIIFTPVSKDPNLKKIQDNIAKHLNFSYTEKADESERAQELWKRIVEGGEKILIILDDVWKELKLERCVGIPLGRHGMGRCAILLTTRDSKVCGDMGCHKTVKLEALSKKDAVDLFLYHAGVSEEENSFGDFKEVANNIVIKCGRLPFAVIAVAKTLKSRPLKEWKQTLQRLQNVEQIHDVKEDLKEVYQSLKLSYDNLKKENAKQLFLFCSVLPEGFTIDIEYLTRFAVHLGLCGEANSFTPIMNELIHSSLLLEAGNESVRMHRLVREVALWIGNEEVQVVMNSKATLKENIKYSSWNIVDDDFPEHFDGKKLEALFVWIDNKNSPTLKVSDAIFKGMETLKVLTLVSSSKLKISAASLFQSPQSLKNVQALVITEFELGDISILKHFESLECLGLERCSISKLPKEVAELEKLRSLSMIECLIQENNPFEALTSCLEELDFVSNKMVEQNLESQSLITVLPKLQRYHITGRMIVEASSISRYFDSRDLGVTFSKEIFKSLVAKAEVLILEGDCYNREWTNIVPDILSEEDHLKKLSLDSLNGMKCLIDNETVRTEVAIFSKLAKLKLSSMDVSKICHGPYPTDFLKKLEKLKLSKCKKLDGTLFNDKLELCYLKSMYLCECSMSCVFSLSIAQSLKQLETLHVENCSDLKSIIEKSTDDDDGDHDHDQKSHVSMFPKLKDLLIKVCPELRSVFPICICEDLPLLENMKIHECEKLEYIFGKCSTDGSYKHQMRKEDILQFLGEVNISKVPRFINIYADCYLPSPCSDEVQKSACPTTKVEDGTCSLSRACLCCLSPKSNASTTHHPSASTATQLNHNHLVRHAVNIAHGPFEPPFILYPHRSLRRIAIDELCELKSLFILSAASAFESLKILQVTGCATLQHIVVDEEHDHDHMNHHSIFPNLQEITVTNCSHLEYIFPAFYSKGLAHLKSVSITKVDRLTHVFGKCHADKNQNAQVDLDLPALKQLHLGEIPKLVNICADKYSMKELDLEEISLEGCQKLFTVNALKENFVGMHKRQDSLPRRKEGCQQPFSLETLKDLFVVRNERQETLTRRKALPLEEKCNSFSNSHEFAESKNECVETKSWLSFQNLSILRIKGCNQLKFILSASTSRMLQKLRKLEVSDCEELVTIIEDAAKDKRNQGCFLNLRGIEVKHCRSLKSLFSRSYGKLPKLLYVNIEDAPKLEQVFEWNQEEGKELKIKKVVPKMCAIRLVNLPSLHTICQGIDFQTVEIRHVRRCPTTISSLSKDSFLSSLKSLWRSADRDSSYILRDLWSWDIDDEEKGSSPEDNGNDSTLPQQNNGENKGTNASSNEIVEENLSATKPSNSDVKTETSTNEIEEEQLSTSNKEATPSSESDRNLKITPEGSKSSNEAPERVDEPAIEYSSKDTSNKTLSSTISSSNSEMTSLLEKTMNQPETSTEKEMKFDQGNHHQFTDDDLMRLFQIMEEDAETQVHMSQVSKVAALEDESELSKALTDLEVSLKMGLNEIVCSEESKLRIQNALNILSSYCSEDGTLSHGLQTTIHSLQQEIETVLSSSKQAYATIDIFNELQQKEKLIMEERVMRKEAAISLLSKIKSNESLLAEAQEKEAELKEQLSKIQADIQMCELELLSLKKQKKESVSDTLGFLNEFEKVKKDSSHMVEENIKATQQIENMNVKWSSCLFNLQKTTLLLGVHLHQKL